MEGLYNYLIKVGTHSKKKIRCLNVNNKVSRLIGKTACMSITNSTRNTHVWLYTGSSLTATLQPASSELAYEKNDLIIRSNYTYMYTYEMGFVHATAVITYYSTPRFRIIYGFRIP